MKIKKKYRFRILIKGKDSENLTHILESVYVNYNKNYKTSEIGLSIDVNPVNLL